MNNDSIDLLRHYSRKLVRELGMLQLNKMEAKEQPSYWHTLIEINKEPDLTVSKLSQLLLISLPTASRIVFTLIKDGLVTTREGLDKRERFLNITDKGREKIDYIDDYSNNKIKRAFHFLTLEERTQLINSIEKYANALEKGRQIRDQVKILRLSSSRTLRKQIISMIEHIQVQEFNLPITPEINAPILKAEEEYYYHRTCNFWYATDDKGAIIGCIGLKKLNEKQAEVKKFFVISEYRGLGVAQQLMHHLVKSSLKHGFEELFLGTVGVLDAAQRFYVKNGFRIIKKELLPKQFQLCLLDTHFYGGDTHEIQKALSRLL
ncbi:bifunctional helix-turn-helix transcriptional regulator/GNAT family N-acetyltransferase [Legionella fallonii]|uniref:IAA acetyltransferase/MarR transcriptional regulatory protein n=1 Tax=Legionella fallonii LLAP-10 TaxID=1212491 RepID=A0A098G297_9GAMM|nr:bifunctional helix-turn-helix transcriptional regulator/GNAT family N-acetyltransferase [Legionella fallonii]CEG56602.1 IAA acetyltransferase/MarR transcriptional regulatory protein [Legionella fallonii LLAP-10]